MPWKWDYAEFKNPTARARGMGSARYGFTHWMWQRITAVANIFLVIWGMWAVIQIAGMDYYQFSAWLSYPLHAIPLALLVISLFLHACIGLQVIVEDYIHHEGYKVLKILGIRLVIIACAVACIFSIIKIAD